LNWDAHIIPGIATNANITGAIVTYNSPMLAPSINGISVSSDLEINAAGLNIDGSVPDGSGNSYGLAAFAVSSGAFLNVNAGGVLRATNCGFAAVNGTMNVGGTVVLDNCGTNSTPPAAAMVSSGVLNVTNGVFEATNSAPLFLNVGALNVN